ncbi:Rod shape-determining protein RodA [Anaerococcus prevotii]|uniref:Rod shape-determining protein RodA n=1 Tax=Anaerococcus prevotii (strain ATCC 9321 / DSM 20548 / JCM 6508 / NCTC 11806 / PC1) TaxID=525919 RepID=C7RH27_ANAPD|nr:rod shape-determining protein RodA [Anaerococcus prevotii]ACV28788.1 rod shape-determining protein RodA [Anaerococcus prevotii DSM 20548]SUU94463.1 Rod shape-determining protein RodA [Anaerococcus prevotii]
MFNLKKKDLKELDLMLLFATIALSVIGLVVLYSAYGGNIRPILTQLFATILGFVIILVLCTIDLDFIKRSYLGVYGVMIVLLLLTLVFGRGLDEWGAKSWVYIGSFSFQPSEIAKVGIIFSLAAFLDKHKFDINDKLTLLKVIAMAGLPIGLILLQPDFGTAMVYVFFVSAMIFIGGISWKWIGIFAGLAAIVGFFVLTNLSGYRLDRIENFLDPSRDTSGSNWQQQQGLIAIGSGMLTGRGYLKGTQSQYGYIPEKETDFIFSVLAEELGFLGAIIVIALFAIVIMRLVIIAKTSRNTFITIMLTGIAGLLFIHIFENIAMTIGLMPVTGIPLPFFSYGGTFQLISLINIGLALSASMQKKQYDDGIIDDEAINLLDVSMVRPSKRK